MTDDRRTHRERKGLVTILWGDGKGKTSTAMGMALRALGRGFNVHLVSFLKDPETPSGELSLLDRQPGFSREGWGVREWVDGRPDATATASARRGLDAAMRAVRDPRVAVVILDEILYAVGLGALAIQDVLEVVDAKLAATDLILTGGWQVDPALFAAADLVTELRKRKHPFDSGAPARAGFEY